MKRIITSINIVLLLGLAAFAQPVYVKNIPLESSNFTEVGNTLFFTSGDTLWKSNGTTEGTVILKTGLNDPGNLVELNGLLYFQNNRFGTFPQYRWRELWSSNGTASGTVMLKSSDVDEVRIMSTIGGTLYFTVHTASQGRELWKTNGTVAGTQLVKDIRPGSASGISTTFSEVVNGELYFVANDGIHGNELWKSNGTNAGTVLVEDINPGSGNGVFINFSSSAVANNNLFFIGNDGVHGPELWKSNGTTAGTFLLRDINPSSSPTLFEETEGGFIDYFPPVNLTAVGGIVYFVPKESFEDGEFVHLWKSNGTTTGTVEVKKVPVENVDQFTQINGKLIFVGLFGVSQQIWTSDGTTAGTIKIKDNTLGGDNYYGLFLPINNQLVFTENFQGYGFQLWKTDGTLAGTRMIKRLFAPPRDFEVVNNFLFYTSNGVETYLEGGDGVNDLELWQSDLTPDGTFMVKNISDRSFAFSGNLEEVNNSLFFSTDAGFRISSRPAMPTLWKYSPDPFVVHEMTLVDSDSDSDIRALNPQDTIYTNQNSAIRAKVSGPVGSVRFLVNGVQRRIENVAPYSIAGDIEGDYAELELAEGLYTITAIPYSGANATGTAGDPFTRTIRVMRFIASFTLIDADEDREIRDLHDYDTIPYSTSSKITLRANPRVTVGSVSFILDGSFFWRENTAPYALRGDTEGDYAPWNATFGDHVLTTQAYSGPNGTGTLLETQTIHFRVVPATPIPPLRTQEVNMFPNPASNQISVAINGANDQIMEISIVNSSGSIFYQGQYNNVFGSIGIDLTNLDMTTGVYFVKIRTADSEERIVKLIKN